MARFDVKLAQILRCLAMSLLASRQLRNALPRCGYQCWLGRKICSATHWYERQTVLSYDRRAQSGRDYHGIMTGTLRVLRELWRQVHQADMAELDSRKTLKEALKLALDGDEKPDSIRDSITSPR